MASAATTLLCATRFWALRSSPTTATLRSGVRHVVRKQGFSPAEIDRAERTLIKRGLLRRGGARSGSSLALTERGFKITSRACPRVSLAPWDMSTALGGVFDFLKRKKKPTAAPPRDRKKAPVGQRTMMYIPGRGDVLAASRRRKRRR